MWAIRCDGMRAKLILNKGSPRNVIKVILMAPISRFGNPFILWTIIYCTSRGGAKKLKVYIHPFLGIVLFFIFPLG